MTDTPRLWDRRADETPKSYAAFLAYVALGARRSVREAARQRGVRLAGPALPAGRGGATALALPAVYRAVATALRRIVTARTSP